MACDNQDAVAEQNDEWIVARHYFSEASMDRIDNARTRPWLPPDVENRTAPSLTERPYSYTTGWDAISRAACFTPGLGSAARC